MHSILYVEINLLAILVLLIIMDRGARSVLTMDRKLLKYTEISLIVVMALDIFTWMLDGASFPGAGAAVLISPVCVLAGFAASVLSGCHVLLQRHVRTCRPEMFLYPGRAGSVVDGSRFDESAHRLDLYH